MKNYIINVWLILLLLMAAYIPAAAQERELTEEDKELVETRVAQKVREFQNFLSEIANGKLSSQRRLNSMKSALALFIGGGERYTIEEWRRTRSSGEKVLVPVEHAAPFVQVSNIKRTSITQSPIKKYLKKQYDSGNVFNIKIEWADKIYLTDLKPDPRVPGRYVCTAIMLQYYQKFYGDKPNYKDASTKSVVVYVDAVDLPDGDTLWDAKLGDIYVLETHKL